METGFDDLTLTLAHERKLLDAVDALEELRHHLVAVAAVTRHSAHAVRRQAAQAQRRSHELISDAARLMATAERLVAEARSIHGERA